MSSSPANKSRPARKGDPLTGREVQVLSLVAAGEPTAVISGLLGIAENTVKSHLTNIYRKTGCRNRVQAARHYLDNHIVGSATRVPLSHPPGDHSLIEQQMSDLQARLDQLAPAASEVARLQHALDALRALSGK
jgi:DNA-binding CsgD family transcriptional regulator